MRSQYYPQMIDAGLGLAKTISDEAESWATSSGQGALFDGTDFVDPYQQNMGWLSEDVLSDDDLFELRTSDAWTTEPGGWS